MPAPTDHARALREFSDLPDDAFVRLPVVISLFGFSAATVWRASKDGRLPKPVKLGPAISGWPVGGLRRKLSELVAQSGES
jgi:predicted DNA-binding transcriptional regulator AlpA